MALHGMPLVADVRGALRRAESMPGWSALRTMRQAAAAAEPGNDPGGMLLVPLLSMLLPDIPRQALILLAQCLPATA